MKYGCHNRSDYAPYHMAQDGYTSSKPDSDSRLPKMVKVPHVMTRDCQYTLTELGKVDSKCNHCKHKK